MNLSKILSSSKRKSKKRLGCGVGSGHGKTSCKGHKGQKARSGGSIRRGFEGGQMPLYRRLPKRGFNSFEKTVYEVVNVEQLNDLSEKAVVNPALLYEKGIVGKKSALVKILGNGDLKKSLTVQAHKFSGSAVKKIEEAKGKVEVIK